MKNIITLCTLLCGILTSSCSQNPQGECLVIDLVNHKQLAVEQIALSDISESIQIIPLETNDSVLVGRIYGIKLASNKLYVNASNGILVFDSNGKFLNTVGSKGRGPKEYVGLYDIFPENDIVWLLDDSGKKALKYTSSGRFLEDFDFEKHRFMEYFHSGSDTFIGFVPDLGQTDTDIMLAFFDSTGITDSLLYRNPITETGTMVMLYEEATFINNGAKTKFKHVFNDTIYVVKDCKLIPDMALNLGARKANEKARAEAAKQDMFTADPFKGMDRALLYGENDRYLYLKVESVSVFYDKKEQKVHKWEFSLPDDKRIDPEQSKKFLPKYIDKYGNLIGETTPANIEDNQVIIIAKLKR